MRQHLTAVQAAAAVGAATVRGAEIGATTLEFAPATLRGGAHQFNIGSAGSATLVLQTVLPALLLAPEPSTVVVEGGTHNPLAPPFEYLHAVYLPLLVRMGADVTATLERHGFYPSGGGRVRVAVRPAGRLRPLTLVERGAATGRQARALFAGLPFAVARRELDTVRARLGWEAGECVPREVESPGPGNAVEVELRFEEVTELFTACGERGVRAETVAETVVAEVERYLASTAPVGAHLADQLLLPCALAGGGSFVATETTPHFDTQCAVLERFLPCRVARTQLAPSACRIDVYA
jgi:RNA 3'-terminal phosphate cyclase (ATP)